MGRGEREWKEVKREWKVGERECGDGRGKSDPVGRVERGRTRVERLKRWNASGAVGVEKATLSATVVIPLPLRGLAYSGFALVVYRPMR